MKKAQKCQKIIKKVTLFMKKYLQYADDEKVSKTRKYRKITKIATHGFRR